VAQEAFELVSKAVELGDDVADAGIDRSKLRHNGGVRKHSSQRGYTYRQIKLNIRHHTLHPYMTRGAWRVAS
jgi:hypothetical protein